MKVLFLRFLSFKFLVIFFALWLPAQSGKAPADALMIVGTWKLNLAKSKYNSGPPPKIINIHTWWWDGDSLKHKVERVNEKGETVAVTGLWSAKYDAKDHLSGGAEDSRVSMKRIDAYTTEMTEGTPGRPLSIFRQVVSRDGKILTITRKTEGQDVVDVMVHDRQ